MTQKRLAYVDMARGVAACAVVALHVVVLNRPSTGLTGEFVRMLLYAVSIPLFAFLSGLVTGALNRQAPTLLVEIRKRFLALMVPYYTWCVVYWLIQPTGVHHSAQDLGRYIVEVTLNPYAQGRMWFLYVLFACQVAFALAVRVSTRSSWILSSIVVVVTLSTMSTFSGASWMYVCLVVGFLLGRRPAGLMLRPRQQLLALVVGTAALPFAIEKIGATPSLMARFHLPGAGAVGQAAFLVSGLCFSLAVTSILRTVSAQGQAARTLAYLGQRSLGVYVTQFLFVDRLGTIPVWSMPIAWAAVLGLSLIAEGALNSTGVTRTVFLGQFRKPDKRTLDDAVVAPG